MMHAAAVVTRDNESLQPGKDSFPYVTHVGTERLLPGAVDH